MLKCIVGVKGTGKTKSLINMVNEAVDASHGDVVCLEKGTNLRFDIKYQARLINTDEYAIDNANSLYGFIAGILASNHDVTELFVDGVLKICGGDIDALNTILEKVDALSNASGTKVVFTVSLPTAEASETLTKFM